MDGFTPKNYNEGPEDKIQAAVKKMLEDKGWLVCRLVGNAFQSGLPDLFATCPTVSNHIRLIEIKLPNMIGSRFTPAQLDMFPKLCKYGAGVWILTAATDVEYRKLFHPPNFWFYLGKHY